MEGGSLSSMEEKGKAKAANVMSEDMKPKNEPFPAAVVISGGDDTAKDGETSKEESPPYTCKYCKKMFLTAQGLGGHQNTHRFARELAKKPRVEEHTPPLTYPNYDGSPNILSLGYPKLPFFYSKNFIALPLPSPSPPFPYYSHAIYGFPTTQYSQLTNGLTMGHSSQPSHMLLNNRQVPVFNRPRMNMPNTMYNVDANYTSGNFNFGTTMVGGQGDKNLDRCFPSVGFGATGTSRGVVRNFSGVLEGENIVSGRDEGDGTIDLLSRVGMGRGDYEESNGKGGNGDSES